VTASGSTYLGKDPADHTYPWQEWHVQAFIVMQLKRANVKVAASMEQGKRSKQTAGKAKATGMVAGEPDLRIYLSMGRVVFIELKMEKTGKLSPVQEDYHEALIELGHAVHTVWALSPLDGWLQVQEILEGHDAP
jgi:hypothetical protein